jgi:nicotinate-nucleotide--dimethylbenzimidazole phosphoribosyltransferase
MGAACHDGGMNLEGALRSVVPPDAGAARAADERQLRLTKPPGSMGRLEGLGAQLAGIAGVCPPPLPSPVAVAVFAGDHGVHAQGVTPWPQEVTVQMVANVCAGGAVVNALARQVGADVVVVDVGVVGDPPPHAILTSAKAGRGTADLSAGPAMSRDACGAALQTGVDTAVRLVEAGYRLLVTGDLGLANTTASAAVIAALTGRDATSVTGRGAGADDAMLAHKRAIVEQAVGRFDGPALDRGGIEVLTEVGGFEHAALAGFVLGAAALRVPVLLDGVIACSAALAAARLQPAVVGYLVAGHRSEEPGAAVALEALGLEPLLDLGLRLGEGSGAVLAVPLVQAAARMLREVATFDTAGVSEGR